MLRRNLSCEPSSDCRYLSHRVALPGFDRGCAVERLQKEGGDQSLQDKEIQEVSGTKPQLAFPCRIAVYLKPPSGGDWRWTSQDKEILNRSAKELEKEGIASSIILMSGVFAKDGDLKHLHMEAARYGADALLVIQGAQQTDSYLNPAAVLNLTVVGGFIIPASHRDTLSSSRECLWMSATAACTRR